jgi:beta-xylosidase
MHCATRNRTVRAALCAIAALATLVACFAVRAPAATAQSAGGMFAAGQVWTGEFADPAILRVGSTYYAYATVTGGDNLPVAHSRDLVTWYARNAYPADANPGWWSGYNDALPHPARWGRYDIVRNGRLFTSPWAPSVAAVGGTYVAAYSVPVNGPNRNRRCISVATSASPIGPFVDRTTSPLVCSSDPNGSNDPQVFTPDSKSAYLLWKNTGVPGSQPTKIWSRRLDAAGTGFARGSSAHLLLATAQAWEGNVIENPAMIRYAGRYYLFYSANSYGTSKYAIGYAICTSPIGSCRRPQRTPLLASGGRVAGPGGPAPIVGPGGALRLGYAAWDTGHVGYADPANERRLHVALLTVGTLGALRVSTRG